MTAKNTATPTTPEIDWTAYNKAVAAGLKASKTAGNAAWTLGDLAAGVVSGYGENKIKDYADAIEIAVGTLRNYRTVAVRYPASKRSKINTFTVHEKFASLANADKLLKDGPDGTGRAWTAREARKYVTSLKTGDGAGGNDSDDQNDGNDAEPTPALSPLQKARLHLQELQAETMKTMALIVKLEAEEAAKASTNTPAPAKATTPKATTPKATTPKATTRISDTVDAASVRARYAARNATPAGSPRRSRTRVAA